MEEDFSTRSREATELTGEDWDNVVTRREWEESRRSHSKPASQPAPVMPEREPETDDEDSDGADQESN